MEEDVKEEEDVEEEMAVADLEVAEDEGGRAVFETHLLEGRHHFIHTLAQVAPSPATSTATAAIATATYVSMSVLTVVTVMSAE